MYKIDRRGGARGGSKNRSLGQTLKIDKNYVHAKLIERIQRIPIKSTKIAVLVAMYSSCTREGVQSSSNSNQRHPNLFCSKRAPQLVISTTSNSNQPKTA